MKLGDRVTICRPNLWANETGTIKKINTTKGVTTDYIVRADRNFDIKATPEELKPTEP